MPTEPDRPKDGVGADVVANSPPVLLPNPLLVLEFDETFAAVAAAALSVLPMGKPPILRMLMRHVHHHQAVIPATVGTQVFCIPTGFPPPRE